MNPLGKPLPELQPMPMAQSTHKAWAGVIAGAALPVLGWLITGEPLPDDYDLALLDLVLLAAQMVIGAAFTGAVVYRTTNYKLEE